MKLENTVQKELGKYDSSTIGSSTEKLSSLEKADTGPDLPKSNFSFFDEDKVSSVDDLALSHTNNKLNGDNKNNVNYSLEENTALGGSYQGLNIEQLWYGENQNLTASIVNDQDDDYWNFTFHQDVESETMTVEEAEDCYTEMQYEAAAHSVGQVSFEKKRKFDFMIKFEPAMFQIFENLYCITRDVDYSSK